MEQEGAGRTLPAGRSAVDAYSGRIDPGVLRGSRLDPRNAVGKPSILEILPAHVVKGFGAPVGAHPIDDHHDETEFCDVHGGEVFEEFLGNVISVRSGIDFLHHRIFLGRIEVARAMDDSPNIGRAIPALGHETFWHRPAGNFLKEADVRFFEFADQAAVIGAAQFVDGRQIDA